MAVRGLFAFLLLSVVAGVCFGLVEFPVYRLFQMDVYKVGQENSKNFDMLGSRRSSMDGIALPFRKAKQTLANLVNQEGGNASSSNEFIKHVLVIDLMDYDLPNELFPVLKAAAEHGAAGIILAIPSLKFLSSTEWRKLELRFVTKPFPDYCPVYVAFREQIPNDVSVYGGSVSLAINAKPLIPMNGPKQKGTFELSNIIATLKGAHADTDQLPTVAVVANYDTFGIAPAIASAAAESAAPVSVLMELYRLFSALYTSGTRPDYNMQFVLTSGAALNYAGLRSWASKLDTAPEFVLCLDSLLDNSDRPQDEDGMYYLHVSKPGNKDASVQAVYDKLIAGAKVAGANLEVRQKKVNVARDEFDWPHEALAVKRFLSATLTRCQVPPGVGHMLGADRMLLARSTLFDRVFPNRATLSRATRIAAEGLVRIVYKDALKLAAEEETAPVFQGKLSVNSDRLHSWAHSLSDRSRCMPAASQAGSELVRALQGAMSPSTVQNWILSGKDTAKQGTTGLVVDEVDEDEVATAQSKLRYVFYSWPLNVDTKIKCVVHARTPALWDLFMLIFTAGFLFVLYAVLHGFSQTIKDAVAIFAQKPKEE